MQRIAKNKTTIFVLLFIFFIFGIFLSSNNFVLTKGYSAYAYTSSVGDYHELYATEIDLSTAKRDGSGEREGKDFLISNASTEYSFSSTKIVFKGGYIIASIPIKTGDYAGIYSAMREQDMRVSVNFNGKIKALEIGSGEPNFISYIGFLRDFTNLDSLGSGLSSIETNLQLISAKEDIHDLSNSDLHDKRDISTNNTVDFIASLGDSLGVNQGNAVNYSPSDMFSLEQEAPNPHVILVIKAQSNDMKLEVSEPKLSVEVSFKPDKTLSISAATMVISGSNRQTVTITDLDGGGMATVGSSTFPMDKVYIKSGDSIEIRYKIKVGQKEFSISEFRDKFKNISKIFNSRFETDDVLWRYFVKHSDLSNEQRASLIEETKEISGEYGIIRFRVAPAGVLGATHEIPEENKLHIIPRLFDANKDGKISYSNYDNSVDFQTFINDSANTVWSLNIDNSSPQKPIIDLTSDFGKTINNKTWYTKSNGAPINLIEDSYNSEALLDETDTIVGGENKLDSLERLYAIALPSNVSTISIDAIDFGSSNITYQGREVSLLGALKTKSDDLNKLVKEFNGGEVNTLILVTVDRAGNVSPVSVYSLDQGNAVRVDGSTKRISLSMFVADSMFPSTQYPNFGIGYFYEDKGDGVLYENGELKDNLPTAGTGIQVGYSGEFKRDAKVVIRFSMNEEQASKYMLVRYNNSNNSPGITVDQAIGKEIETTAAKKIIHYDMIYEILDNDWDSINGLEIKLHFGELINISHNQTLYTFRTGYSGLGVPQDINNDFDAYSKIDQTPITPKPEMKTEYFETVEYSIRVYVAEEGIPGRRAVVTLSTDISHPIEISTTSLVPMSKKGYTLILPYGEGVLNLTTLETVTKSAGSTTEFDLYNITAIDIDKPKEDPFIDAGTYGYRVSVKVDENSRYYGSTIGSYTIERASAQLNQLQQMGVLYFGDSLGLFGNSYDYEYMIGDEIYYKIDGKLKLESKNNLGQSIYHDDAIQIGDDFYHASYIRDLYGIYTVLSPLYSGEYGDDFSLPSSDENYPIRVEYQPIDLSSFDEETIQNNFAFFQKYYEEVEQDGQIKYVLKKGTLHSGNYKKAEARIDIKIRPKQATIFVSDGQTDVVERVYNGDSQVINFAAEADRPLQIFNDNITDPVERKNSVVFKVRYKIGEVWSEVAPINAGTYEVEARIDNSKCNYTSEPLYISLRVDKKQLDIEIDEEATENNYTIVTKKDLPFEFDNLVGITGIYEIDYMYMYLNRPMLNSIHTDIEVVEGSYDHIEYIENYLFSIYSVSESDWIYSDLRNSINNFLDVGDYIFEVSIDDLNFKGKEYIKVRVNPPSGAVITEPTISLLENYETYALDGTHLGKTGHIEYGQILNESLDILDIASARPLIFRPATGAHIIVNGRFYFESEEKYYERTQLTREYSPLDPNKLILSVRYDGNNPISHKVKLIWEAGEYENDIFIKNNNFDVYEQEVDLNVVRALLDFDNVFLTSIKYKTTFDSSLIEGYIKSNGFSLDRNTYTLSLVDEQLEGQQINGGNHLIKYNFSFNEDYLDLNKHYYFYGEVQIPLTVTPREVTINLPLSNISDGDLDDYDEIEDNKDENKGLIYYYSHENKESEEVNIIDNETGETIEGNVRLSYMYFRTKAEGELPGVGESIDPNYPNFIKIPDINRSTKPGRYIVVVRISNNESNYIGSIQKPCYVIKSELNISENLPDLEYGYMLEDLHYLLEDITLNNDNQSNPIKFLGKLIFVENTLISSIGNQAYEVSFIPTSNETLYQYFKPFKKSLTFNVIKRKVQFEYEPEDFIYTYNAKEQKPTIKIKHPVTQEYISEEILDVILDIEYSNSNGKVLSIIDAGNYTLKVKIREDISNEYTEVLQGEDTKNIVINKAKINFSNEDIEEKYTGNVQSPLPEFTSDFNIDNYYDELLHSFNKTFINYVGNVVEPIKVGKYSMNISVTHRNFEGSQNLTFYIVPSILSFSNLNQTYANPNSSERLTDVGIIFERVIIDGVEVPHQSVAYIVEYMYQTETVWTSLRPNGNAGIYKVRIKFNQDGYIKTLTENLNGEELKLIVAKKEIEFSNYNIENQLRTFYYNGSAITTRFLLGEFSSLASYEYIKIDEDNVNYIDGVPYNEDGISYKDLPGYQNFAITAGIYYTRISVSGSGNYEGTYYTTVTIRKANLTITTAPSLIGESIEYGSKSEDINQLINQNSATIEWQKYGSSAPPEIMGNIGQWIISQNIENYIVGDYGIDVVYELNDEYATNFNNPLSKLYIKIIKKDISDNLYFIENSLTQKYKARELKAEAIVDREGANILDTYPEIKLTLLYKKDSGGDFSPAFPKEVGLYDVKVRVDDYNYTGEKISNKKFKIERAIPTIVQIPRLPNINLGEKYPEQDKILTSGKAIIPGTQVSVSGYFEVMVDPEKVFSKANENDIQLRFIPYETQNYVDTVVQASIWVEGDKITSVVTNVEYIGEGNAVYGESLSNFSISGTAKDDEGNAKEGRFEWVNPELIPNVDEEVNFQFIPDDDTFNIYYGKTTIILNLGTMEYDANKSYLRVHKGQTILDAINNKQYYIHIVDADGLSITQYDVSIVGTPENLGRVVEDADIALPFVECRLEVKNPNYAPINIDITSWAMEKINADNIRLSKTKKSYDGFPINIKEYLKINETSYQISNDHIKISKILNSLNEEILESETIYPGTYKFYISIDERSYKEDGSLFDQGKYYGENVVEFTITKRDVTNDILINNNEISFIDVNSYVNFMVDDEGISNEFLDVKYYRLRNDVLLGSSQPRALGDYYVVVTFLPTHPYYSSTKKRFDYTVQKAKLNIVFDRLEYQVTFGQQYIIVPSFNYIYDGKEEKVSLVENEGYELSYVDKNNINQAIDKPQNAGNYIVTVKVIGMDGYEGTASVDLKIDKAKTHIVTSPYSPEKPIKYGDSLLNDVKLLGGRAVEITNQEPITGVFFLSDPVIGDKPDAGEYDDIRVVFQPFSPNYDVAYSSMSIKVEQRDIDFKFRNLSVFYTGEAVWPIFTTILDEEIETIVTAETLDGASVLYPIYVGTYKITVKSNHKNYKGETTTEFKINYAKLVCTENPETSNISYGDKLQSSSIFGGVFKNPNNIELGAVAGNIEYKYPNLALIGGVGVYEQEYIFTPNDKNYENYEGVINVRVVKKLLSFTVEDTTFVYGDLIKAPRFVFLEGEEAEVNNVDFENDLNTGVIRDVGTYGSYIAKIEDDNYYGQAEYNINILKKVVSLDYYVVDKLDSKLVNVYQTQYGQTLNKLIRVNPASLALFDMDKVDLISQGIQVEYGKVNSSSRFLNAPVDVGEYIIYPKMENLSNYTLRSTESIRFNIVKATVSISFDNASLTNNVYGSTILPPTIITSPVSAKVKVKITFPGSSQAIPQSAGTHAVKAEIIDDNYNAAQINSLFVIKRKALAIKNIVAYDKAYDGLSEIRITGELEGIEGGDEVKLSMQGETIDGRFNVGVHKIAIRKMSISGLDASNYYVNKPLVDNLEIKIKKETMYDYNSESYARNLNGFDPNVSIEFIDVKDPANKTNGFTKLIGQTAVVKRIVVMRNGIETTVDEPIKFYIKLPADMIESKNLKVEFKGNLAGQSIQVEREDDYLTFNANSSGEILIYSNEFPYWTIIIAGAILMLIVGIIAILIAYPLKKRKKVSKEVQKAHEFGIADEEAQIKAERRAQKQEIDKRRNWRK